MRLLSDTAPVMLVPPLVVGRTSFFGTVLLGSGLLFLGALFVWIGAISANGCQAALYTGRVHAEGRWLRQPRSEAALLA